MEILFIELKFSESKRVSHLISNVAGSTDACVCRMKFVNYMDTINSFKSVLYSRNHLFFPSVCIQCKIFRN